MTTSRVDKKFFLILILSLLGLAGVFTIFYSTRWGIGLNHDSMFFLGGAESILRGRGYSYMQLGEVRTITKWPPLYSLALSSFGLIAMNVSEAARWVNALLFGINIVLVGSIVYAKTTRLWLSVTASFLMLTSTDMLAIHTMAFTEPLYIPCALAALYFLDKYLESSSVNPLIVSALFIAAGTLTRYVGVTLILTACISILILSKRALRQRLVDCTIAGFVSSLPLLLWQVRNWRTSRHETPLASGAELFKVEFQTHLIEARHLKPAVTAISGWLLPPPVPMSVQVLVLVVVVLGLVLAVTWLRRHEAIPFVYLNLTYVVIYCLGLALFISFVSRDIYFESRYLLPVFVSVVLIVTISFSQILRNATLSVRILIPVLCLLLSVSCLQRSIAVAQHFRYYGRGFEGPVWTQSDIVRSLKNLPGDVRVYSNLPILVIFLTQKQTYAVPPKLDPNSEEPYAAYSQKLQEINASSQSRRTLLFYVPLKASYFPSEDELKRTISLKKIKSEPVGSLYEVVPQGRLNQ